MIEEHVSDRSGTKFARDILFLDRLRRELGKGKADTATNRGGDHDIGCGQFEEGVGKNADRTE
jgi:hypothetical protein